MATIIFHGDAQARSDLLAALQNHCTCSTDVTGGRALGRCPGHASLIEDQRYVDHMEFGRYLSAQMQAEEQTEVHRNAE